MEKLNSLKYNWMNSPLRWKRILFWAVFIVTGLMLINLAFRLAILLAVFTFGFFVGNYFKRKRMTPIKVYKM